MMFRSKGFGPPWVESHTLFFYIQQFVHTFLTNIFYFYFHFLVHYLKNSIPLKHSTQLKRTYKFFYVLFVQVKAHVNLNWKVVYVNYCYKIIRKVLLYCSDMPLSLVQLLISKLVLLSFFLGLESFVLLIFCVCLFFLMRNLEFVW